MKSKIIGIGSYLPEQIITNHDLSKNIDTSDEWITTRTGIKQRHISNDSTAYMGYMAATNAIKNAKISNNNIDLIIVASTTPEDAFPSIATKIQSMLSIKNTPAFDIQAVCSGFIYGLHIASSLINNPQSNYRNILFIASEKMSNLLDWQDRSTSVLFGDGAGAIVINNDITNNLQNNYQNAIIDSYIAADGSFYDILKTSKNSNNLHKIQMEGNKVFKLAISKMIESINIILEKNNLTAEQIDYFVPHQANIRIINNIRDYLKIPNEKMITTIDKHANCSAASIPLALNSLKNNAIIKENSLILCTSFGAGATWGAALLKI